MNGIQTKSQTIVQPSAPKLLHVEEVEATSYSKLFKKSFKKVEKTLELCTSLEQASKKCSTADQQKIAQVVQNLKVWALHYLSQGAKIPVLNQWGSLNLSFVDYLNKDNTATYYRGDGGAIVDIFEALFKENYPCLEGHQFGVVKPSKFPELMKSACADPELQKFYGGNYKYAVVQDIDEVSISTLEERSFIDVSTLLQSARQSGKIEEVFQQIQAKVDTLPPQTVVGGVIMIGQGVGVYVFFNPSSERDEDLQDNIDDGLFAKFKNFRGAIGAFPDIILIKEALIKEGYDLKNLCELNPNIPTNSNSKKEATNSNSPASRHGIETQRINLIEKFNTLATTKQHPLVQHYFPLMQSLLTGIGQEQLIAFENHPDLEKNVLNFASNALDNISQQLDKITVNIGNSQETATDPEKFSQITQRINIITEEILSLIAVYSPVKPFTNLAEHLNDTLPTKVESTEIQRSFLQYSSGMSAADHLVGSNLHARNDSLSKPKIVFLQGSYYELTLDTGLKGKYHDSCNIEVLNIDETLKSKDIDVLMLDLHPNFVTLKEVKTNPVVNLVHKALENRTSDKPLTVVLDTATTLFTNDEVKAIVKEFQQQIAEGKVVFVIGTSLAKFFNCGLDKYPGGLIECYYNPKNEFSEKMLDRLQQKMNDDPMSHESQHFYSLIFSNSLKPIQAFHGQIKVNNNQLYDALKDELQKNESYVSLGKKEPGIPMLGLHFDHFLQQIAPSLDPVNDQQDYDRALVNLTKLMEFYIYHKAHQRKLPIQIRSSFPFPHTAVVECHSAIRLVAGLEDPQMYATLLKEVNEDLKTYSLMNSDINEKLKELLLKSDEEFKECVSELIPSRTENDITFEKFAKKFVEKFESLKSKEADSEVED